MLKYISYGSGYPIIFLHGFELDSRSLVPLIEPIFRNNSKVYKRIYIDLPEMGNSFNTKFISSKETLFEVIKLIKSFKLNYFSLVGQSYGAYISLGISNFFNKKVKSQCLIAPLIIPETQKRNLPILYNKYVSSQNNEFDNDFYKTNVVLNQLKFNMYIKTIKKIIDSNFSYNLNHIMHTSNYSFDFNVLKKSDIETYVFSGKFDNIVGYKDVNQLYKYNKNIKFILFNNSGHNLIIDEYDKFIKYFNCFLNINN